MICKECDKEFAGACCTCGWTAPFVKTSRAPRIPEMQYSWDTLPAWSYLPPEKRNELKAEIAKIVTEAPKGKFVDKKDKAKYWMEKINNLNPSMGKSLSYKLHR